MWLKGRGTEPLVPDSAGGENRSDVSRDQTPTFTELIYVLNIVPFFQHSLVPVMDGWRSRAPSSGNLTAVRLKRPYDSPMTCMKSPKESSIRKRAYRITVINIVTCSPRAKPIFCFDPSDVNGVYSSAHDVRHYLLHRHRSRRPANASVRCAKQKPCPVQPCAVDAPD